MRMTETELLKKFPSFNYYVDPVATWYGDSPAEYHNLKWYEETVSIAGDDDTMCNIFAVDWYIYKVIGEHRLYKTLIGTIGTQETFDGSEAMYGDLSVKYGGLTYNIYYDNIHGKDALTIFHNGDCISGWRNKNGQSSPSARCKELDDDRILKVLDSKSLDDYGFAVKAFIDRVKNVYLKDKENYFMVVKE